MARLTALIERWGIAAVMGIAVILLFVGLGSSGLWEPWEMDRADLSRAIADPPQVLAAIAASPQDQARLLQTSAQRAGVVLRLADFDQPGAKLPPENVCIIGLRDVDPKEAELLADSGVTYFTMRDVDEMGMRGVVEAGMKVAGKGKDGVHLSFDLDSVDPQWAPGTGTKVDGGLTFREAHFALEILSDWGRLTSLEFVEVNPLLDTGNKTGCFAVGLIASALGKAIVPD